MVRGVSGGDCCDELERLRAEKRRAEESETDTWGRYVEGIRLMDTVVELAFWRGVCAHRAAWLDEHADMVRRLLPSVEERNTLDTWKMMQGVLADCAAQSAELRRWAS